MSVVLVTGGAGYVGSHTVNALAAAGYDVVVYDDLSNGHAAAVERLAVAHPGRSIRLVRGDILDARAVEGALRDSGAVAVLHFAARLLVGESVREPLAYYQTNVAGALAVLGAMRQAGASRFIFSSTAATFGEPERTPIDEDHPQRPVNAYGETKLALERTLPHLERAFGLRWTVLRYFNAAGADPDGEIGEDHHPEIHLIPRAIEAVNGGRRLQVFGADYATPDGTCLRDYVHVADLADAHVLALQFIVRTDTSTVYNLGTGRPNSVKEVIEAVEHVSGRAVPWALGPRRPGDPAVLYARPTKAQNELGWTPRFPDLETIVRTAWDWHQSHPHGYSPSKDVLP